ncbi:MAG TPA: hypothetical protein VMM56_06425, partial [Planctomycetaceae bacterium]|nr:hypothetical protein [Planctomycetaceae bacterium]
MDAQDAYDILDALANEPVSELTPLQEEALRCAEESPEIAREYRARTPFDRQISDRIGDVEIPAGLKERLLENAQRESERTATVAPDSKSDSTSPRRVSRRRVLAALTGLAACSLLVYWYRQSPQLVSAEIDHLLTELWSVEAQPFDGNFPAELPLGGWRSDRVRFEQNWHGAAFDAHSRHDLAIKRFEFLSNRRTPHQGLLAAVRGKHLAIKPSNRDP